MSEEKQPLIDKSLTSPNAPHSKSVMHEHTDDISDYTDEEDDEYTVT
jgi:hypothetical protein